MPLRRLLSLISPWTFIPMPIHWSSRSCRRVPNAYLSVLNTLAKKACPVKHGSLCLRNVIGGSIYGMHKTSKNIRYCRLVLKHGMIHQRWHIGNLFLVYFVSKISWLLRQPHTYTGLVDRLLKPCDMMMLSSSASLPKKQVHSYTPSKLSIFGGLLGDPYRSSSNAGSRHRLGSSRHSKSNGTHTSNNLKLAVQWMQPTCLLHAISFNLHREVSRRTALFMTSLPCNRSGICSVAHCLAKQLDLIPLLRDYSMFFPLRRLGYFSISSWRSILGRPNHWPIKVVSWRLFPNGSVPPLLSISVGLCYCHP